MEIYSSLTEDRAAANGAYLPTDSSESARNEFLADYINGYTIYKDIYERLKEYGIYPKYRYYFVVSVFVKDYGILKHDAQKDTSFAINNILEDLLDTENVLRTRTNGVNVYIINCRTDSIEKQSEIIECFEEANRLISNILEISFIAGISEVKEGFESLPELFAQSDTAIGYARFYDSEEFVRYDDIRHEDKNIGGGERVFPKETELMLNIKSGYSETVKPTIDSMFATENAILNEQWYFMGLAYNILNNIVSLVGMADGVTYRRIIAEAKKIGHNPTIKDIKQMLCTAGEIACEYFESESKKTGGVYDMTKQYILNHYCDHNLDVSSLGEALNMTGFYISRIFKQHSGMKVTVYISKLRIERAKNVLIEQPDMKIADVGYSVGFDNQRTFLKIFKENVGVTPTQYGNTNAEKLKSE